MTIEEVRLALAAWRRNPRENVRMPRYVTMDGYYFDTTNPVDAAMIRKAIREGRETLPTVADMDRAHRAEDKRMRRAEKRLRLANG